MVQGAIETEAARGGSRSGWELCQLVGSSCPPDIDDIASKILKYLKQSKLLNDDTLEFGVSLSCLFL